MNNALAALAFAAAMATSTAAFAEPDLTSEMYSRSDFLGGTTYTVGDEILLSFKVMNSPAGTSNAPGTLSAGTAGWMADVILSTDRVGPRGFATFSPTWHEDVLLRGGRMSRTNDLAPNAEQMFNGPTTMRGGPPPRPYDYLAFPMPTGVPPGAYFVCVISDPANVVREVNERNNATCAPITIRAATIRPPRIRIRPERLPQPTP